MAMKIKSLKQESILKQFYIYFLVASVIPFIVFIYLIVQFISIGKMDTSTVNFKLLLSIAAFFSILGFWGTRSFLIKIVSFTKKLREDNSDKIDKSTILELAQGEGEVAYLAKLFGDITTRLEENIIKLEETKKTLHRVLSKVGKAIGSTENFDTLIQFILETIMDALECKRGAIYMLDEESNVLKPKVALGVEEKYVLKEIKLGEETVGWVAKEGKSLLIPGLDEKEENISLFTPPLIAAPIVVRDKISGAISLSGKSREESFSEDELKILSNLAYQIAVAFENAKLNIEIERTYFETMSALALAVEAKDPYSRGHSERVLQYSTKIAQYLGLPERDLNTLRDAALLHDIGKIGIIDQILKKAESLNSEEQKIMQQHPNIGEEIVKPLRSFRHIIDPIKHHHEFLDGSGYPDGLKADQIPLLTRVLTVADIFDAMNSDRPYRKALNADKTKQEFQCMVEKGKVDKMAVEALFQLIEDRKL